MKANAANIAEAKEYKKKYGFTTKAEYVDFEKGISEEVIRKISKMKGEPEWMLENRLAGYRAFNAKPMPAWGPDLSAIDFDEFYYYKMPKAKEANKWEDVPDEIKQTFEKLGVPEAERRFFAGAEAQLDSGVIYSSINETLEKLGVIFVDTDTALRKHPELFKKYFGTAIGPNDNKFAALNTAAWSGGSFVYVPKGVKVPLPLNAYFRINARLAGQFERTLIVVEEGADVTYLEGCTSPVYSTNSLHAAVVEVFAHKDSHVRYITVQNWTKGVYNMVTQRAHAHENAHVEWTDVNIGSKINMKYPCICLIGDGAKGEILSVALAGDGQVQDMGGKLNLIAPNTTGRMVSKSISKGSGVANFRGKVLVGKNAEHAKVGTSCNALLIDDKAKTNTYPYLDIHRSDAVVSHEARVGKISEEEIFYIMSRGIGESDAVAMIILGFLSDLTSVLPADYSLELKRLIKLDMEGSAS